MSRAQLLTRLRAVRFSRRSQCRENCTKAIDVAAYFFHRFVKVA
jgi:hypothetical protein